MEDEGTDLPILALWRRASYPGSSARTLPVRRFRHPTRTGPPSVSWRPDD